jgi:hypothetical protein
LLAGAAALSLAGTSTLVMAQTAPAAAPPGTLPSGAPPSTNGPSGERANLNLSTEAADLFARDRNVSVTQRPHEGYQARGLRMGGFLAYPKISLTPEYNDNIYALQNLKRSDTIFHVTPEVSLNSDWSRHALNMYARAVINRYAKYDSENTEDYGVGVNGRLDVLRFTNVTANVDWARLTEPRSSPNSPGVAARPVQYDLTSAGLTGQHTVNRIRLSAHYDIQDFRYDSPPKIGGGRVDQSFRDRDEHNFTGRADYAISPDTAVFAEIDGNIRNYKHRQAGQVKRDSSGVQGLVGVNFELSALTRGELAVGYLKQNFKDPALRDISSFGARGRVEWFPTQLTTVTFSASRTVEDSAVPGTGAYLSTNIGAQVDHELLRNVILSARAGYGWDKYKEINRRDERPSAGISATYLLNRSLGLTAAYAYDQTKSIRGVGNPFKQNKVSATLTAQF